MVRMAWYELLVATSNWEGSEILYMEIGHKARSYLLIHSWPPILWQNFHSRSCQGSLITITGLRKVVYGHYPARSSKEYKISRWSITSDLCIYTPINRSQISLPAHIIYPKFTMAPAASAPHTLENGIPYSVKLTIGIPQPLFSMPHTMTKLTILQITTGSSHSTTMESVLLWPKCSRTQQAMKPSMSLHRLRVCSIQNTAALKTTYTLRWSY